MKKTVYKLIIFILVLITMCSVCGCSFVDDIGEVIDGGNSGNNESIVEGADSPHTLFEDSVEGNVKRANVTFNTYENRPEKDLTNAINSVKRTSVAISMKGGLGSGVIVDMKKEGVNDSKIIYILTCHHVISETGEIKVYLPDANCLYDNKDYIFTGVIGGNTENNKTQAVTLIGGDFYSDIALLQLNLDIPAMSGKKLSPFNIVKAKIPSNDYIMATGEEIFAIGNPTGELPGTFTFGYVAYPERKVSIENIGEMTLMQIGVSTNPGSSGGGLYNLHGELIGITNAGNTEYEQINFAIPFVLLSDLTKSKSNYGFKIVAEQLLSTAWENNYGVMEGSRRRFGFSVQEIEEGSVKKVKVIEVIENSIASKAGLKVGDIIESTSVNGTAKEIHSLSDFSLVFDSLKIGNVVNLKGYHQTSSKGKTNFSTSMKCTQFWFCNTGIYNK